MAGRKRHNLLEEDWDDSVSSNSKLIRTATTPGKANDNETVSSSCSYSQKDGLHEYAIPEIGQMDNNIVEKNLAIFIISNNIAFDAVEAPSFVEFVKGVAQRGPKFKLPTALMLRSKSFPDVEMEVEKYVRNVKQSWALKGCTIMLGEWKNFINVVAYSPDGAVFFKLHKIPKYQKSKVVENIISSAIENIGVNHVVQMVTNSDMVFNISENVLKKYSQIYKIRCVAHEIHVLLKAIYDGVGWVRVAIDHAAVVVKCMYADVNILSLMRQYTKSRELKHPCKSKFASNYQMLQSILDNKNELQKLILSKKWKTLKNNKRAVEISDIIKSGIFWNQVQDVLIVMDPLVQVLRLVEDDRSTSGYLYIAMEKAREAIKRYYNNGHVQDMTILDLFEKWRSNYIIHPIHAAAALLNPAYMCQSDFKFNAEMSKGIDFVLETLVRNEEKEKFIEEMQLYQAKISKVFNTMAHQLMKVSHPRVWWDYTGVYLPVLKKYAIPILSQTCKCSCDLKPSAFEVAQTKMMSQAMSTSQEKILYTAMNAKIMENFRSLEEQRLLPMDLENCNELPDYIDPKQSWWDDETEAISENSNDDANNDTDKLPLDEKSNDKWSFFSYTSLNSSSKGKPRRRWRKTFTVICISNYLSALSRFYGGHCQSFVAGGKKYNNCSSAKLCKPFIIHIDSAKKARGDGKRSSM